MKVERQLLYILVFFFISFPLFGQSDPITEEMKPPALIVEKQAPRSLLQSLWWLPGVVGLLWMGYLARSSQQGLAPQAAQAPQPQAAQAPPFETKAPASVPQSEAQIEEEELSDPELLGAILKKRFAGATEIGTGGMATVYKGEDKFLERTVAVKIMHPRLARDPVMRKRFIREARTLARLNHPGILRIYEVYEEKLPHFTTELLEGENLRERMVGGPAMDREDGMSFIYELATAVAYAHKKGVLHRDLTPNNVFVDQHGKPRLIDFGLARAKDLTTITKTDQVFGTPPFMAPEVFDGDLMDPRSDIYSFGLTIGLMVGSGPKIIDVEPLIEDAPITLVELAQRCYRPKRDERPPSMQVIVDELAKIVGQSPKKDLRRSSLDQMKLVGALYTLHASCLHSLLNELRLLDLDGAGEERLSKLMKAAHRENLRRRVEGNTGLEKQLATIRQVRKAAPDGTESDKLTVALDKSFSIATSLVKLNKMLDDETKMAEANELIDELLPLLKPTSTAISAVLETHSFHLASLLDKLSQMAPDGMEIEISKRHPGPLPLLVVNCEESERLVGEVMSNVMTNAKQAGANKIEFRAERLCDGSYLELTFLDDGQGLDGRCLDELIRPGKSAKASGTGTGLLFCVETMSSFGGEFRLFEKEDKGASASLLLPTFMTERLWA